MNNLPIEIKSVILGFLDSKSQFNFVFTSKKNQNLIEYWEINHQICINNKI